MESFLTKTRTDESRVQRPNWGLLPPRPPDDRRDRDGLTGGPELALRRPATDIEGRRRLIGLGIGGLCAAPARLRPSSKPMIRIHQHVSARRHASARQRGL